MGQCDVSLANRRSCQACRYKKCIAAGMKPGLVLSDEQCSKRFGPRKGEGEGRSSGEAGTAAMKQTNLEERSHDHLVEVEQETVIENEFAVLIDNDKSYEEQNKIGRQLFVSLFTTGSVNAQKMPDEQLEKLDELSDNFALMLSFQIDRQLSNARKFLPFNRPSKERSLFLPTGQVNTSDVLNTLIEQTVLLLKHNQHFTALSKTDQTELMEENVMVAALLSCFQLYNRKHQNITWQLAEADFKYLRTSSIKTANTRISFFLQDILSRIEPDLKKEFIKIFNFFEYFSLIGVTKSALNLLIIAVIFSFDNCNLQDKKTVEGHRHHYLLLVFDCLSQTEGVLGACSIASKLHGMVHDLERICQLIGQKMVNVKD